MLRLKRPRDDTEIDEEPDAGAKKLKQEEKDDEKEEKEALPRVFRCWADTEALMNADRLEEPARTDAEIDERRKAIEHELRDIRAAKHLVDAPDVANEDESDEADHRSKRPQEAFCVSCDTCYWSWMSGIFSDFLVHIHRADKKRAREFRRRLTWLAFLKHRYDDLFTNQFFGARIQSLELSDKLSGPDADKFAALLANDGLAQRRQFEDQLVIKILEPEYRDDFNVYAKSMRQFVSTLSVAIPKSSLDRFATHIRVPCNSWLVDDE